MNLTQTTTATAYLNGLWYDGNRFRAEPVYVRDGHLTRKKPNTSTPLETVDLRGGYVIPPLADAHCHHFDNDYMVNTLVPQYLKEGIFYAQSMTNWRSGRKWVASRVNTPTSVDVSYADAGLTCTNGHGVEVYEYLANRDALAGATAAQIKATVRASHKAENDAYYIVDNAAMIAPVFDRIRRTPPDFLKIYLLHSEKHAELVRGDGIGDKGLDPTLIPEVVRQARRLKLWVYAHVESVFDFRTALDAGINGIAHLPGYAFPLDLAHPELYRLTEDDARKAGKHKLVVQATAWLAVGYAGKDAEGQEKLARTRELERYNLGLLKKHGARIVVGSDSYGTGPWPEAEYLAALGVFTPAEMLKLWTETTPQSIFPHRKIGRLAEGYEASFLVLDRNPQESLQNLKTIQMRVKNGVPLLLPG